MSISYNMFVLYTYMYWIKKQTEVLGNLRFRSS